MAAQIEIQELLESLQEKRPQEVVQQYRHNLLPSRLLLNLYNDHPDKEVLLFLALYPAVPSQILQSISETSEDPEVIAAVATNPRCTHNLLIKLSKEGCPAARAALAANKLQSQKVTTELVKDPNLFVRIALAKNKAITKPFQCALALDQEPAVRQALSTIPKLDPELAYALTLDESAVVRASLYAYGKVDENMLLGWALSDDIEAQQFLLTRKKISHEIMESLCLSPYESVQKVAQELHEPLPHELLARAESESKLIRIEVAKRELLPPAIQHILANDANEEVRITLAHNPEIDEEVALFIAASNDPDTCMALAQNPYIPNKVKIELCHHDNNRVRIQMAYREDLSHDLLELLINKNKDLAVISHLAICGKGYSHTSPSVLEQLIELRRVSMRIFATTSERIEPRQLNKLARDPIPAVRLAACKNATITTEQLETLTKDWNEEVSNTATKRLETSQKTEQTVNKKQEKTFKEEEKGVVSRIVRFFSN